MSSKNLMPWRAARPYTTFLWIYSNVLMAEISTVQSIYKIGRFSEKYRPSILTYWPPNQIWWGISFPLEAVKQNLSISDAKFAMLSMSVKSWDMSTAHTPLHFQSLGLKVLSHKSMLNFCFSSQIASEIANKQIFWISGSNSVRAPRGYLRL